MSAYRALDADSQQQLVTQTRDLTLVNSPNAIMLLPPPCASPASTPCAESGDATPQHRSQGEPAARTATTVDAQPPADNLDLDPIQNQNAMLDREERAVAAQPAITSCPSPGEATSTRPFSSSSESSSVSGLYEEGIADNMVTRPPSLLRWGWDMLSLDYLPNEILTHILGFLDVCDLLATSRINHHFRSLSLHPILHILRLRRVRQCLPPLLTSPSRPTLTDLIARHIFLTHTTQISRRLARNLVAIRLSRRLPLRPSAESLVQRGVLPSECVEGSVAPGLVAKKRAVEKEKLKDGLRRWVGAVWRGEVRERSEGVKKWEEHAGVGRVWRLRRFWERIGRGSDVQDVSILSFGEGWAVGYHEE
ncbi:hypothetical protein F5B20DRAFT_467910 [Whalleya microplaca]|nr:hypothetical protein F5B20DRAFT_467910 [Whalleya microplaca]